MKIGDKDSSLRDEMGLQTMGGVIIMHQERKNKGYVRRREGITRKEEGRISRGNKEEEEG